MRIATTLAGFALAALILPGCKHQVAHDTRAAGSTAGTAKRGSAPPGDAGRGSAPCCGDEIVATVRLALTRPARTASQLVMPVEKRLRGLPGVASVETVITRSRVGFVVHARKRLDRMETQEQKLRKQIEREVARANLPTLDGEPPRVRTLSGQRRLILIAAHGASPARLKAWSISVQAAVARVSGVAHVEPVAPIQPQVQVTVDPDKLRSFGISTADVANNLSRVLASQPAAHTELARFGDTRLAIGVAKGAHVRLRDVARIERGYASSPAAWFHGHRAALLRVDFAAEPVAGVTRAAKKATSSGIELDISGPVTVSRCGESGIPRISGPVALVRIAGKKTSVQGIDKAVHGDALVVRGAPVLGAPTPEARPEIELVGFETDQNRARTRAGQWLRALASMPDLAADTAAPTADQLRLVVTFQDASERRRIVRLVRAGLRRAPAPISIGPVPEPTPTLAVKVDRAAAARLGVPPADVSQSVRFALSRRDVGDLKLAGGPVQVVVGLARRSGSSTTALRGVFVRSATGARVPLAEVAEIAVSPRPPATRRLDGRPFIPFELLCSSRPSRALRTWIRRALVPQLQSQVPGLDAHVENVR